MQDEETLVYADIGQRPAPVKSNPLLLDDNRVEYALLDHTAQQQKSSTAQESSIAQKSGKYCQQVHVFTKCWQYRSLIIDIIILLCHELMKFSS